MRDCCRIASPKARWLILGEATQASGFPLFSVIKTGLVEMVNCGETNTAAQNDRESQGTFSHGCIMTKLLFLAVLIGVFQDVRAAVPDASSPKSKEMADWFQMTGVRWAIYSEFILPNDTAQTASTGVWVAKTTESMKPTFARSQSAYLAEARKEAERFQIRWSEGIREVLKVTTLTREEADRILAYMIERRAAAKKLATELATLRRMDLPASAPADSASTSGGK
jgi:hypothetical protein